MDKFVSREVKVSLLLNLRFVKLCTEIVMTIEWWMVMTLYVWFIIMNSTMSWLLSLMMCEIWLCYMFMYVGFDRSWCMFEWYGLCELGALNWIYILNMYYACLDNVFGWLNYWFGWYVCIAWLELWCFSGFIELCNNAFRFAPVMCYVIDCWISHT